MKLTATILAALLILTPHPALADDKLHVGVIIPLSGEAASWGAAFKNGMTLGMDKISSNARSKLDLRFADGGIAPVKSMSSLQQLMASGPLDVVINESSGTGKALAPVLEEKKITFISVSSDAKVSAGRKYVFNFWVTPETEVKVLLPEIARRNFKRIARIGTLHDGIIAVTDAFDKENKVQVSFTLDEMFPLDVKDFRTYLTKLRHVEKDTDAVMVVLLPGQLGIFARQLRDMGIKLPIFGVETLEDIEEVKQARGALEGAWYVNAEDGSNEFLNEYRLKFPGASSFSAANGFDAIQLLAKAIDSGVEPAKLNEFLASIKDFKGALGTYSATGDQRFSLPATLKVVTKDGFELLKNP